MAVSKYELGVNCGETEILQSRMFVDAARLSGLLAERITIECSWVTRAELGGLVAGWSPEVAQGWAEAGEVLQRLVSDGGLEGADYVDLGIEGIESGILMVEGMTIGLMRLPEGVVDLHMFRECDKKGTSVMLFPEGITLEDQRKFIVTIKGTRSIGDRVESNRAGNRVGILKKHFNMGELGQVLGDWIEYYVNIDGVWFMNPYLSWAMVERNLSE